MRPIAIAAVVGLAASCGQPLKESPTPCGGTTGSNSTGGSTGSSSTGSGSTGGTCAAAGESCPVESCCPGLQCSAAGVDTGICEPPCQTDSDCKAPGTYCDFPLTACPGTTDSIAAPGYCHRNCFEQGCRCLGDADCPGGSCHNGTCAAVGAACVALPCTADCPQTSFAEAPCPVCLCPSCPVGSSPPICGSGPDAGVCNENEICCARWGGAAVNPDGGPTVGCSLLGPDGGCPPGAICDSDGGASAPSCNFYFP